MLEFNLEIDALIKPEVQDEMTELEEGETFLHQLGPEELELYLEFAMHYNTVTRLKKKAQKILAKGSALKDLFWIGVKENSELAEQYDEKEGYMLTVRLRDGKPCIVGRPNNSDGPPEFFKRLIDILE